jgi:hypothetical protein
MSENIYLKLYWFATVRQTLEEKTEKFLKSITELEKNKTTKNMSVLVLAEKSRRLLAELQVMDNHMKGILKMPLTTQIVMDELVALRKLEVRFYSYCSEYNEILQSMLSQINTA